MFKLKALCLSFVLLFVSACGSTTGSKGNPSVTMHRLNGAEYGFIENGTLKATETSVAGTGKILFRDARPHEDSSYLISFSLEDGGSIHLVTNADNKLSSGITLTFARSGAKLSMIVQVGSEKYDVSADFAALDATKPQRVDLEVHGHGHVKVYGVGSEMLEYGFRTRVPGRFWGFVLDRATLTEAKADKAKPE